MSKEIGECLVCGKYGSLTKKGYCSRECSLAHKKNKCLNCGDACKGKYCKKEIIITCKVCKKEHKTTCKETISTYCSGACAMKDKRVQEKVKATQIKRYGSLGFNTKKQKDTMLERYGYLSPAKNDNVKEKIKKTQLENNDGCFAFNTIKQKSTMLNKYGSLGRLGSEEELNKQKEIMLSRYGVSTPCENPEFLKKAQNTLLRNHGRVFNNNVVSKVNLEYAELIKNEFNIDVEFEHRLETSFFDLYLPDYNIAIDINPTITHNSTTSFACVRNKCHLPCETHPPLKNSYHLDRALLAKRHNLRLIQIFEWDKEEDIKKMLSAKVSPAKRKCSARSLLLQEITQSEANKFLNKYHIQGATKKQTKCYGLFDGEELLAVSTFGPSRFNKNYEWEFIRYAVKENIIIHGGSGKLVSHFIKEMKPFSIISYVDFNHTTAKHTFLNSAGFKEVEGTGARLVFHNREKGKMIPMSSLLKIGADKILGTNYGPVSKCGMNNREIMLKEDFLEVYTAGNRIFVWERK